MTRLRGRRRHRVAVTMLTIVAVVPMTACTDDDDLGEPVDTAPAPTTAPEDEAPPATAAPVDEPVDEPGEPGDEPGEPGDVAPPVTGPPGDGSGDEGAEDPDGEEPVEAGVVWERVDDDPRVFGAVPPVVTALGTGVDTAFAVGRTRDGTRALLVWTSSDGRTWSVIDGATAFGGASGEAVEIRDLVARGNGFVAVGIEVLEPATPSGPSDDSDDEGDPAEADSPTDAPDDSDAGGVTSPVDAASGGRVRGAVWVSDDGIGWERTIDGAGLLEGDGNVLLTGVVTGGPGLIAVGSADVDDARHGAVWLSSDGTGWLRVPHDPAVFGDEGRTSIEDVVVDPSRVVAVGVAPGIGRETRGAVWVSDDGIGWRAVGHDSTVFGGVGTSVRINAVTAGGPGFVAVGSERLLVDGSVRFDAAAWWSVDGEVWERVDPADQVLAGPGSQVLWDVVAIDDRLIAVGGDTGAGAVWVSDDGRSWERVPASAQLFGDGGATQLQRIVLLEDRVIAAGVSDEFVPIWSSPPIDG